MAFEGLEMVTGVAAIMCFSTLLVSGLNHARRPRLFAATIDRQGFFTGRLSTSLAFAVLSTEIALGVFAALNFVALPASADPWRGSAAAAMVLCAAFAGYAHLLVRERGGLPCGCSQDEEPATRAVVGRAMALSVAGAVVCFGPLPAITPSASGIDIVIVTLAGVSLAMIVWVLPSAIRPSVGGSRPITAESSAYDR